MKKSRLIVLLCALLGICGTVKVEGQTPQRPSITGVAMPLFLRKIWNIPVII